MFRNALIGILTVIMIVACAPNKDKKRNIRPATAAQDKANAKGGQALPQKGDNATGSQEGSTAKIPGADSNAPLDLNRGKEKNKDNETANPQSNIEETIKEYNEADKQVTELYGPINVQLGVNSIREVAYEGFDKDIIANDISSESIKLLNDSVDQLIQLEKKQLQRLQQIEKSGYYGNHDKKLILDIISKVNIKLEILQELSAWIKERIKSEAQTSEDVRI